MTGKLRIPPENRLLLLCSRVVLTGQHMRNIHQLLDRGLNWDKFIDGVIHQGIPTLVYHHLNRPDFEDQVPTRHWNILEQANTVTQLQTMRQRHEFKRLMISLAGDVIPLKGLFLREFVYPEPGLRPSGDIDLLIRLSAVEGVDTALQALGYLPDETLHPKNWYQPENNHHFVPYRQSDRDVLIEVHWQLAPPRANLQIDIESLWERSSLGQIAGCPVRILSPEDLLLHLCLHASVWCKTPPPRSLPDLRHLVDIAEVVRAFRSKINWDIILDRAFEWETQNTLHWILSVTRDLLDVRELDQPMNTLMSARLNHTTRQRSRLYIARLLTQDKTESGTYSLIHFIMSQPMGVRLRIMMDRTFLPPEEMRQLYGLHSESKLVFLYYLVRPILLLFRYTRLLTWNYAKLMMTGSS